MQRADAPCSLSSQDQKPSSRIETPRCPRAGEARIGGELSPACMGPAAGAHRGTLSSPVEILFLEGGEVCQFGRIGHRPRSFDGDAKRLTVLSSAVRTRWRSHLESSTHPKSDGMIRGRSTSPLDPAWAKAVRAFRVRAVFSFNQASMPGSTIPISSAPWLCSSPRRP